jgi:transcriptional regulator with XRE-family HTH domain
MCLRLSDHLEVWSVTLGEHIRTKRRAEGLSLRDLAERLGIDHSTLAYIEQGRNLPSNEVIPGLASYLGFTEARVIVRRERERRERDLEQLADLQRQPPFLPPEQIESFANQDRATVLQHLRRDHFTFPYDRDLIPTLLCGLRVIYEPVLFGVTDTKVYAGLFVDDHPYHGESNVIVVATRNVRRRRWEETSQRTQTFHAVHEIGHHRLHRQRATEIKFRLPDRPIYCSSGDKSPFEFQANAYAAAFLMPRDEIHRLIGHRHRVNMRREGKRLCDYFFVEPQMLRFRLGSLKIRVGAYPFR